MSNDPTHPPRSDAAAAAAERAGENFTDDGGEREVVNGMSGEELRLHRLLSTLRNPWGVSEDVVRQARLDACNEIEDLQKRLMDITGRYSRSKMQDAVDRREAAQKLAEWIQNNGAVRDWLDFRNEDQLHIDWLTNIILEAMK